MRQHPKSRPTKRQRSPKPGELVLILNAAGQGREISRFCLVLPGERWVRVR